MSSVSYHTSYYSWVPEAPCNGYTTEMRPTPHFAASICSYCYINALSDVARVLLPFTDSRGVICGSWTPRLLQRQLHIHWPKFLLTTKQAFVFFFCWRRAFIKAWNAWYHLTLTNLHTLFFYCTPHNKARDDYALFSHFVAVWGRKQEPDCLWKRENKSVDTVIVDFISEVLIY